MSNDVRRFWNSDYFKKVTKVVSGTFGAQLITVGTTFLLARIYSVESFGYFELVVSTSMIFGTVLSFRYEMAIMLPKFDKLAFNIFVLALKLTFLLAFLLFLLILIITGLIDIPYSSDILFLSLIGGLGVCLLNISTMWHNRIEKYGYSAWFKILRASLVFGAQFSLLNFSFNGLALGFSVGFCTIGLISVSIPFFYNKNRELSNKYLQFLLLKKYMKFSLWALPSALTNTIASALPLYFIGGIFSSTEAGLFGMLRRLIYGPITLISESVNQVVFQEFTKMIALRKNIVQRYLKTILNMSLASTVVLIVMTLAVVLNVFSWLLGSDWSSLESLYFYMIPTLFFGFISKAVSRFAIFGRTDIGFVFQLALLVITALAFIFSKWLGFSFNQAILLYSIMQTLVFALQQLLMYRLALKT